MSLLPATGLIHAALGIYSVVAWLVAQHTREIGVRMALGASPAHLVWQVVGHGMRPVLVGLLAGLAGAAAASRLLQGQLSRSALVIPVTLGAMIVLLVIVGVVAAFIPARRATGIDPA